MNKLIPFTLSLLATPLFALASLSQTPALKIDAVVSGLEKAIATKAIAKDSALDQSIHQFLALVGAGASPEAAAEKTRVKLAVIRRLEQLGVKTPTANWSAANPVPQESDHDKLEAILKRLDAIDAKLSSTIKPATSPVPDPLIALAQPSRAIADKASEPQSLLVAKPVLESKPTITANAEPQPEPTHSEAEPIIINPVNPKPAVVVVQSTGVLKPKIAATSQDMANAIVRGLSVANRTGEIGYSNALSAKVQNVIRSLRRGEPLPKAAQTAEVPQKTIDRLLALGHYQKDS